MTVKTLEQHRAPEPGRLDRFFGLSRAGTNAGREVVAGMTTFGAMSYVLVVNPAILSSAGLDRHGLIIVTAVAAMLGTLLMALWARLPVGLAPGMGTNVIFAQVVILQMGLSYHIALTMVLAGGLMFMLLSLTGWRERIILGFPGSIRLGIQCGIGTLIAYLGLKNGGLLVVGNHQVSFGTLSDPAVLLTYAGILVTPVLVAMRLPAALLLSIAAITVIGLFVHLPDGTPVTRLPTALWDWPHYPTQYLFAVDVRGFFSHFFIVLPLTLYFFLADFFSATATLMAVCGRSPMATPEGRIPRAYQAFAADGVAAAMSGLLGTSTVGAYIESAAGVEAGGRTGLTALTVAVLFGLGLFLWPVISIVPPQATTGVLVVVGLLMLRGLAELDTSVPENTIPPLLMVLLIATTTNLMIALCSGCFVYTLIVLLRGQVRKLTPMLIGLDVTLLLYLVLTRHM